LKIVFFGSSEFAVPSLRALVSAGLAPVLVVTKPDAPRGRGKKIYENDLKLGVDELAKEIGVKLAMVQPADPNEKEFLAELRRLAPDVGVVVSYGVLLSRDLFELPKLGCINAHASLLPKYRGAAPIEHCIRNGERETGISIMRIAAELDTGDVLLQDKTPIDPRENAGILRARLAVLAGESLVKALRLIAAGKDKYVPQDHGKATYAPKLQKEQGVLSWKLPAEQIDLMVRAYTPKPGAQTRLGAKRFIVLEGQTEADLYGLGDPGRIQSAGEEGIRVCTGKDLYRITRIKPENGRNMSAGEFVRGHPLPPDARFG
jgi:methionyl-tRNA formyltransferase